MSPVRVPAHLTVPPRPDHGPHLGCAGGGRGCPGSCCDPVWIAVPPDRAHIVDDPNYSTETRANAEWIAGHFTHDPDAERPDGAAGWAYRCDAFVHGTCTAHDSRPPLCRRYPDDGGVVDPDRAFLHGHCSYLLDVPPASRPPGSRPLIPVDVIRP